MTKTIIIGLGNPILGDDGVGWVVAEEIKQQLGARTDVDVMCLSLGGLSLMEQLIGYVQAILVDSFKSDEPSGTVLVMNLNDLPNFSAQHTTNIHDLSLQNALEMGRKLGAELPRRVMVVGITAENVSDFSEELSPEVQSAVPIARQAVLSALTV